MNYRSIVVFGTATAITSHDAKAAALTAIVEHLVPGRTAEVRPMHDDEADYASDTWAWVIPAMLTFGTPVPDGRLPGGIAVPPSVARYRRG